MNEKIEMMYKAGLSCRAIGRNLGIHHAKVSKHLKYVGLFKVKDKTVRSEETQNMISLYNDGYSYEDIANMFGFTRQAIWERLKCAGCKSREKAPLPFVMYDGIKWTVANSHGYFRNTNRTSRGELLLHRYKYSVEVGVVPSDWDVHHIDHNKLNNDISNLQAMPKNEHTALHQELKKCK